MEEAVDRWRSVKVNEWLGRPIPIATDPTLAHYHQIAKVTVMNITVYNIFFSLSIYSLY